MRNPEQARTAGVEDMRGEEERGIAEAMGSPKDKTLRAQP